MAAPVTIPLPETTAAKVAALAAREHRPVADMLRVLAEEAIASRELPATTFADGPTGRTARLVHGPGVWDGIEPNLLSDNDWQLLRESYPDLDERVLRAAVRYYAAYPEASDDRVARRQR